MEISSIVKSTIDFGPDAPTFAEIGAINVATNNKARVTDFSRLIRINSGPNRIEIKRLIGICLGQMSHFPTFLAKYWLLKYRPFHL